MRITHASLTSNGIVTIFDRSREDLEILENRDGGIQYLQKRGFKLVTFEGSTMWFIKNSSY
jgi:hypothetical protein